MNTALKMHHITPAFGSFKVGADYFGQMVAAFRFNNRHHEVVIGTASCDKLKGTYNGTQEDFERDCGSRVGTASYADQTAPEPEVVAYLNKYLQHSHAERVERLRSNPDRFGVIENDDPVLVAPPILTPAYYQQGVGWVKTMTVDQAKALAGL